MLRKDGLISRFFSSNRYILAILVVAPLLLYFVFGTTFYSELDDIDERDMRKYDLDENFDGDVLFINDEIFDEERVLSRVNPDNREENISAMDQFTFEESIFNSLFYLASISFIVGAVIASISWGQMTDEGSIVYMILLKSSRMKAFVEMFSFPLLLILFISVLSSFIVTFETLSPFPDIGFFTVLSYCFLTIFTTMIGGYIVGVFISLIARNSFLPIITSLFLIGGINIFPERSWLLYPSQTLIYNHYFGIPIKGEAILGILFFGGVLILSYLIFKRGDFY